MTEVLTEYQRCENAQVYELESKKNPELFKALQWLVE